MGNGDKRGVYDREEPQWHCQPKTAKNLEKRVATFFLCFMSALSCHALLWRSLIDRVIFGIKGNISPGQFLNVKQLLLAEGQHGLRSCEGDWASLKSYI